MCESTHFLINGNEKETKKKKIEKIEQQIWVVNLKDLYTFSIHGKRILNKETKLDVFKIIMATEIIFEWKIS